MDVVEPNVVSGAGTGIDPGCVLGPVQPEWSQPTRLGEGCLIRTGTIVYADTAFGDRFVTGARAFIREFTVMGSDCVVGANAVIEGRLQAGDGVVIQSAVYI